MASLESSIENSIRQRLEAQSALLRKKQEDLNTLIDTCNEAASKLNKDLSKSVERIYHQRDEQVVIPCLG